MTDPSAARRWRIALPAYWLLLALATHDPRPRLPQPVSATDKIIHFGAFALLAFVFWRVLATRARGLSRRSVWLAALVLIPYAAIDEYTQQWVGRYTDIADWVANVAGIVCMLAVLEVVRRRREARDRGDAGTPGHADNLRSGTER